MTNLTVDGQDGGPPPRIADLPTSTGTRSARVPPHAFVIVGAGQTRPPSVMSRANDNTRAGTPKARSVWRDLFFLAILAMTVAGAFWSGKLNASQRIIVVPGPSSDKHIVT